MDVVEGLGFSGFEAGPGAFMLDEEFAFPEQVDEAVGAAEALDGLFKGGDEAALNAEDVEELVPEGLLVGLFAFGRGPIAREEGGAVANFIPGQVWHRLPDSSCRRA